MPTKYNRYTLETKLRVASAARTGASWKQVALRPNAKYNTAKGWIRRFTAHLELLQERSRGGRTTAKVTAEHVDVLLGQIGGDPDLTLRQLTDRLGCQASISVVLHTIKNHVDAACFTLKQMHKEPQYMDTPVNKEKRRDLLVRLQDYHVMGKVILYMDETNISLWATRTRGRSRRGQRAAKKVFAGGGQNMCVTVCIGINGLVYYETRFGANRMENMNESIRNALRQVMQAPTRDLPNTVLVIDNAPCHSRAEQVFGEDKFAGATLLRIGPYSPMLNPNEGVFSAFKAIIEAYLRDQRMEIIAVPEGVTMKAHRQSFLRAAADTYFPRAATGENCHMFYRHTLRFHVMVVALQDMPVGV